MDRRIEVDGSLEPVVISGRILNKVFAHALQSLPEECCGLIVGTEDQRYRDSETCRNEMTQHHQRDPVTYPRDGTQAFYMNELDYMRVQESAREAEARVTAVYHSHVGADPYLSAMDLQYAENAFFPFPDSDQVVIGVWEERVTGIGLFRRESPERSFVGRPIIVGDS